MKIRVALIGHGHLGKWHLDKILHYHQMAELVAVVEPSEKAQNELKAKRADIKIVSQLEEVLTEIDAAIVVVPTAYHFDICLKLVKANKHVFCEKPVTEKLSQAITLQDELKKRPQLVFQVGHSERFSQGVELISSNTYKELRQKAKLFHFNRLGLYKGRATDVDVIQDLMVHDLDLMLKIIDKTPTRLYAHGVKIQTSHWDSVHAVIHFNDQTVAHLRAARGQTQEERFFELTSSLGVVKVDLLNQQILTCESGQMEPMVKPLEKRDHLLLEHQAFYQSIHEKKEAIIGIKDGLDVMKLIDGVINSIEENKEIILN